MIIITKKFTLRPFKKSDIKSVVKYINDKTIYNNTLHIPYPYKLKHGKEWINKNLSQYYKKQPEKFRLAIEIKNEAVGCVSLEQIQGGHKAELGYWLSRKYWKKGIMTEAVGAMVDYGFQAFDLKRIYAYTFIHNTGSQKVLLNNGFKKEGMLKSNIMKKGELRDEYLFAKVK